MVAEPPPDPFEGVDKSTLSHEEFWARVTAWMAAKRAWELATDGPVRPGDVSRAKIEDVMGDAVARGMHDYRVDRARWAAEHQAPDSDRRPSDNEQGASDDE